jgi:hypothetical protein
MLRFAAALAVASLVASPASAAACRDAKGKFIKCPDKAVAKAKPKQCRDAKGHFKKC